MKVKELIEKLSKLDPELYVFTSGYEAGVDDVVVSEVKQFALDVNDEWYYGKHEEVKNDEDNTLYFDKTIVKGIIL